MTHPFIEHVNLTVSDPDRTAGILSAIFGWHERWRGAARDGGRTIHLGDVIALLLDADIKRVDVKTGAVDDLAGATRGLDGNVERGMHGIFIREQAHFARRSLF